MFGFRRSARARLKAAVKKLKAGDTESAITALLILAKEEQAEAEYWLGRIHEGAQNARKAAHWYRRAAEHGHTLSECCLAHLYLTGATPQFQREALRLYHAAAEKHVPEAQFALGEFYRVGNHVGQDLTTALHWYQQAAQAGYRPAERTIQQMWANGLLREHSFPHQRNLRMGIADTEEPQQADTARQGGHSGASGKALRDIGCDGVAWCARQRRGIAGK